MPGTLQQSGDAAAEALIGKHDPNGFIDDYRVNLALEKSNFDLEEAIPDPHNRFLLLAHEKGFRLNSDYNRVEFNTVLPYENITSIESLNKHIIEKKRTLNYFQLVFFVAAFCFLLPIGFAVVAGFIVTGILGYIYPEEIVYRRIRISFIENGNTFEFTCRYKPANMPEVYRFFTRFIPSKFKD